MEEKKSFKASLIRLIISVCFFTLIALPAILDYLFRKREGSSEDGQ